MRTSRPLKHAPRPLLGPSGSATTKNRGRSSKKRPSEDREGEQSIGVYSYQSGSSRGSKQAANRIRSAREDVASTFGSSSRAAGVAKGKGKGKERFSRDDDGAEDDDGEDSDDDDGFAGGVKDIRNIKFKMGLDSDDEAGGFPSDDDEEIDSDLADTDHEDENGAGPSKAKASKKQRSVASDFYADSPPLELEPAEIDLNEDSYDSEDDDEVYMDLSEMLDSSTKPARSGATSRNEETADNLRAFKPSLDDQAEQGSDERDEDESGSEAVEDSEDDVSDEDDAEEEEEDTEITDDSGDDDDAEDGAGALKKLQGLIAAMPSSNKRALVDAEETAVADLSAGVDRKRRKVAIKERTEALPEGEFAATSTKGGKVTLDALLSGLDTDQAASLRKSLKPLAGQSGSNSSRDGSFDIQAEVDRLKAGESASLARERARKANASSSALKQAGPLPAPLAPLHQAKIERQAAKEKLDEHVQKWGDTVKYMRGISKDGADDPESRLVLPLQTQGAGKGVSGAELVAKFNPANDLERQVSDLIASTGISQSALLATENSALMEALPPASDKSAAHDAARVAQLRLARELMFRAERKAKRVAKIKSRTFRKIAKKSRARGAGEEAGADGALNLDELAELDALDGGLRAEAERERLETARALERATLRHASGASAATAGGRWSRGLKGLDGMDDSIKDAIRQRESKQEQLRRKVLGVGADADLDDLSSGDEEQTDTDDEDVDKIKQRALDDLAALDADSKHTKVLPKGLMGMKFMQRAAAREQNRVDGLIDDFKMQVEAEDGDAAEEVASDARTGKGGELVHDNPGRMVFTPGPNNGSKTHDTVEDLNAAGSATQSGKGRHKKGLKGNASKTSGTVTVATPSEAARIDYNPFTISTEPSHSEKSATNEVNPWLTVDTDSQTSLHISKKNQAKLSARGASASEKVAEKAKKEKSKTKEALERAREDARVDVDLSQTMQTAPITTTSPEESHRRRETAPPPSSSAGIAMDSNVSRVAKRQHDEESSDDEEHAVPEGMVRKQGPNAFKQRDLVARAFAGDNVIADFEEMKRQEIEADAPREEDLTLPGWGSWGGKGVRKQKNAKKIVKKVAGIDASQRKDAKHADVIISEKKDKKAAKYQTKDIPYPYTSRAQYEQRLAQPTGVEWTTRGSHKEMTMPKVLTKPGAVIKPVLKVM